MFRSIFWLWSAHVYAKIKMMEFWGVFFISALVLQMAQARNFDVPLKKLSLDNWKKVKNLIPQKSTSNSFEKAFVSSWHVYVGSYFMYTTCIYDHFMFLISPPHGQTLNQRKFFPSWKLQSHGYYPGVLAWYRIENASVKHWMWSACTKAYTRLHSAHCVYLYHGLSQERYRWCLAHISTWHLDKGHVVSNCYLPISGVVTMA